MTIVTVTRLPTFSGTPSPWVPFSLVGSPTMHQALGDGNDGTYIESANNIATVSRQLAYVVFSNLALPAGAVIEYIQPVVRERHGATGHLTVAELNARNAAGLHKTPWSLSPIGTNPADNAWRSSAGPIYAKASDGVAWSDCDPTTFTAVIAWGPRWYDSSFTSIVTRPALSRVELVVAYRVGPSVTIAAPVAGPLSDPRPAVEWETGETQEAFQVIVVPSNATDSSGRSAGTVNFAPDTVASPAWDSGKRYSATGEAVVGQHLTPGASYYFYVRAWAPAIGDTEMVSSWAVTGPFSVTAATVTAPTIDVAPDEDTYSVRVTVTRVAASGAEQAPTFFSLEQWDEESSTWLEVQGAQRFSGPGPWSYFDSTRSAGETVTYRARGRYVTPTDVEIPSAWVSDTLVVTNRGEWWLKDPTDAFLNMEIDVSGYRETIPKPSEVAYGAGAKGATVTHQGVRLGQHKVSIRTLDADTYAALRSLLNSGRTLVLCSVFGEAWRVQLADQAEVEIIKATPTQSETTPIRAARWVHCTFIEVER